MKIVVGITGGIAAYKVPELVRLLKKAGHEVRCAATEHALEFVTRVTLETVSGAPLYSDLFASGRTEHISLKDWGEMLVVAPATANIIGKVASGIADVGTPFRSTQRGHAEVLGHPYGGARGRRACLRRQRHGPHGRTRSHRTVCQIIITTHRAIGRTTLVSDRRPHLRAH